MIEVLVTIAILAIGLMGLLQMQTRLQKSEVESYQRTQAMILLNDMASRITTNRSNAADYETADPTSDFLGAGMTCPSTNTTLQQRDTAEWCDALQGAAEQTTTNSKVGSMIGGRGCVEDIGSVSAPQYLVTVVWQGLTPIASPPATIACGKEATNIYDDVTTDCTDDLCRRYVSTIVRIATL
ncbi:MAG: pilus assembly protein [Proteobacteria bacterium]|nr:pilus assembly protein [Pseudomonadota bacterium]